MKKQPVFPIFGILSFLGWLLFVTTFSTTWGTGVAYAAPGNTHGTDPKGSGLMDISKAMSSIVQKYGSLDQITDPGDISAFRWLAIAKAYQLQAFNRDTITSTVSEIDTAMSMIIQKYGSLDKVSDSGDLAAFRWLAAAKSLSVQGAAR